MTGVQTCALPICAAPPCVKDGKLAADAWGSGAEVCAEKEFELAGADLTVELAFP
mgnify:CR=1 FL=1